MEESAKEATVVVATDGGDLSPPERTPVRRRLIQSTLFPHRSQESVVKEKEGCDGDVEQDDQDKECCGSQSKRKRKPKPKAMSQPRASKKVAENGKESLSMKVDDKDSAVIVKRRRQKIQQEEQLCVGSPEENDITCSPPESAAGDIRTPRPLRRQAKTTPEKRQAKTTPEKRQAKTTPEKRKVKTPKKKAMNSGLKEACSSHILTNLTQSEHTPQPIPNLRLEAKVTAEENSRIFAGKQIHPFFSSWKMSRKNQESTVENNWCSVERKEKSITFSPIHVFEKVQDDFGSLDWENWVISEKSFIGTNLGLERACLPVFEGSVKSLNFENFLCVSHPTGSSLLQNGICLDKCPIQQEFVSLVQSPIGGESLHPISSTPLADEQVTHNEKLKDIKVDREMDYVDFFSRHSGCVGNPDVECQGRFLQEGMMSYYQGCNNQPENSLWTNKYQPQKAIEVCGNGESVKFVSEWLRLWHERDYRTGKDSTIGDKLIVQNADYNCYGSDCDSEDIAEMSLKNVLLVTGPVGSGKSAAIYACAKEQGFQVIEINASDWRNGALVKQRFGEAVESHWLQWTVENPVGSESKILKSSPIMHDTTAVQEFKDEVFELIPLSDEEDSQITSGIPGKFVCDNRSASDQSEIKSLLLFEDVDATIYEDRGFIATIQQLAETAKRPMILTSNSNNPVLPNNLDRLEVCFTLPSSKELLHHAYRVCAAEKANIQPCLLERFIGYCHRDIRKTIMHLQFWCQGQRHRKDNIVQRIYDPLLFDLDAGHQILPKVIPWGYPSQLSELVEQEITKSLLLMEERSSLMELVEEEELNNNEMQNSAKMCDNEMNSVEAKKEAMLSRHCSIQDDNSFAAPFDTACEFSNSSGSPVAFARRNVRRKLDTVLYSDSGDECFGDGFPVVSSILEGTNNEILEVNRKSPNYQSAERCFNPLSEQLLHSEGQTLEENHYHQSETADRSQIDVTCKSVDVSVVPESSFVPETQINNGTLLFSRTVSCGSVADIEEAVSASIDLMQNFLPVEVNDFNKFSPGLHKISEITENTCNIDTVLVDGEEMGDSHIEGMEAVPRGYQVMDECSRMDFCRGSKSIEKPLSWAATDSVQETWRKLRACHTDLRQYVTPELKDASQVLELASGMTDLISEADLLLGDCQPLIC
ncbi:uncharacterized protein LOC132274545 isoform X2 [Cornus florida]|nr:uncharacterized protein LOC132274545 isoform X2 [Cornus florida]